MSDVPRRILLVDDSQLTLDAVTAVLRQAGYDVYGTSRVDDLRGLLGGWQPSLILADVNMPNVTGPELCRLLKSTYETAHVPVVLFSALPLERLATLAQECEADGYLSKGDLGELPTAIQHLIESMLL